MSKVNPPGGSPGAQPSSEGAEPLQRPKVILGAPEFEGPAQEHDPDPVRALQLMIGAARASVIGDSRQEELAFVHLLEADFAGIRGATRLLQEQTEPAGRISATRNLSAKWRVLIARCEAKIDADRSSDSFLRKATRVISGIVPRVSEPFLSRPENLSRIAALGHSAVGILSAASKQARVDSFLPAFEKAAQHYQNAGDPVAAVGELRRAIRYCAERRVSQIPAVLSHIQKIRERIIVVSTAALSPQFPLPGQDRALLFNQRAYAVLETLAEHRVRDRGEAQRLMAAAQRDLQAARALYEQERDPAKVRFMDTAKLKMLIGRGESLWEVNQALAYGDLAYAEALATGPNYGAPTQGAALPGRPAEINLADRLWALRQLARIYAKYRIPLAAFLMLQHQEALVRSRTTNIKLLDEAMRQIDEFVANNSELALGDPLFETRRQFGRYTELMGRAVAERDRVNERARAMGTAADYADYVISKAYLERAYRAFHAFDGAAFNVPAGDSENPEYRTLITISVQENHRQAFDILHRELNLKKPALTFNEWDVRMPRVSGWKLADDPQSQELRGVDAEVEGYVSRARQNYARLKKRVEQLVDQLRPDFSNDEEIRQGLLEVLAQVRSGKLTPQQMKAFLDGMESLFVHLFWPQDRALVRVTGEVLLPFMRMDLAEALETLALTDELLSQIPDAQRPDQERDLHVARHMRRAAYFSARFAQDLSRRKTDINRLNASLITLSTLRFWHSIYASPHHMEPLTRDLQRELGATLSRAGEITGEAPFFNFLRNETAILVQRSLVQGLRDFNDGLGRVREYSRPTGVETGSAGDLAGLLAHDPAAGIQAIVHTFLSAERLGIAPRTQPLALRSGYGEPLPIEAAVELPIVAEAYAASLEEVLGGGFDDDDEPVLLGEPIEEAEKARPAANDVAQRLNQLRALTGDPASTANDRVGSASGEEEARAALFSPLALPEATHGDMLPSQSAPIEARSESTIGYLDPTPVPDIASEPGIPIDLEAADSADETPTVLTTPPRIPRGRKPGPKQGFIDFQLMLALTGVGLPLLVLWRFLQKKSARPAMRVNPNQKTIPTMPWQVMQPDTRKPADAKPDVSAFMVPSGRQQLSERQELDARNSQFLRALASQLKGQPATMPKAGLPPSPEHGVLSQTRHAPAPRAQEEYGPRRSSATRSHVPARARSSRARGLTSRGQAPRGRPGPKL